MLISWDNFKVKNQNHQDSFQQLCYQLFCNKYRIYSGIFRYINQIGIETEPIKRKGEIIGWQAKFFDKHIDKSKISQSIVKAKKKNPELTKIIIYINQEFGEGKQKKKPQMQLEIEQVARQNKLKLEWFLPSNFEISLTRKSNRLLYETYFKLGKTTSDFVEELYIRTQRKLEKIKTEIIFNGKIKLDYSEDESLILKTIKNNSCAVISGSGGTGKTAIIKDIYLKNKSKIPFFVFKPSEFNVGQIEDFFKNIGSTFDLKNFIDFFKKTKHKVVVIDSAEKIPSLNNQDAIQKFITELINNKWTILFTSRLDYYEDLLITINTLWTKLFEKISFKEIPINILESLSKKHKFRLPKNMKLLNLIKIPFYLNEYLLHYKDFSIKILETEFKKILWDKKIQGMNNTNPEKQKRAKYFTEIAFKRVNNVSFVVDTSDYEVGILEALELDQIIMYDKQQGGYFITHDIYEEWALEKYINKCFNDFDEINDFIKNLGDSLGIRRAFRNWLNSMLDNYTSDLKPLVDAISDDNIAQHWRDEIIIAIQLSPYSVEFYKKYKKLLLNNSDLLTRIIFLTRLSCTEIDLGLFTNLTIQDNINLLQYYMIKPKGMNGWGTLIKFLSDNSETININNSTTIELLKDWVDKNKSGEATRNCGLIAIKLLKKTYLKIDKVDYYAIGKEYEEKLSRIILKSACEVKDEINELFNEYMDTVKKREAERKYKYFGSLSLRSILDIQEIIKCMPLKILELAKTKWFQLPEKDEFNHNRFHKVEESYCLSIDFEDKYYPSSALNTPVYYLLKVKPWETLDFILEFINKTTECYVKSSLDNDINKIQLVIDEKIYYQYISQRLWLTYRGGGPGSPHLLQSIHMALEKWLMEMVDIIEITTIENILKYLLIKSNSASITAIIVSLSLYRNYKLRNILLILLKTKQILNYDNMRRVSEMGIKFLYSMDRAFRNDPIQELFVNERLETTKQSFRNLSLEEVIRNLQIFKQESDDSFEIYQKKIWEIIDEHINKLQKNKTGTQNDQEWRLQLARIDSRIQEITTEKHEDGVLIKFNPNIDKKLKDYSEKSLKDISDRTKFLPLYTWCQYKIKKDKNNYTKKEYDKFENQPIKLLNDVKIMLDRSKSDEYRMPDEKYIPGFVATILLRDYYSKLNDKQINLCKEIIFEEIEKLKPEYYSDNEFVYAILIGLIQILKNKRLEKESKRKIIDILIDSEYKAELILINIISRDLWTIDKKFTSSLFWGYLFLQHKYSNLYDELRERRIRNGSYFNFSIKDVYEQLIEKNNVAINQINSSKFYKIEISDIKTYKSDILINAFKMLPDKITDNDHVEFVTEIVKKISLEFYSQDNDKDFQLTNGFLRKFTFVVLLSSQKNIDKFIQPFVDNFRPSNYGSYFFEEFIYAEDELNKYENFWYVWRKFSNKIISAEKEKYWHSYFSNILKKYLFVVQWPENAEEWHTLKNENGSFFDDLVHDIGNNEDLLFSISFLLNSVGKIYFEKGIYWISDILSKPQKENISLREKNQDTNYYIEIFIRKYIIKNRQQIKKNRKLNYRVLIILDYLINHGSAKAFLLREDIL